ncbi:Histone acetyltransferase [Aphelenchoides besseyi]|nr:Histone acetyltransferase [Aphelenchoides besseyi]
MEDQPRNKKQRLSNPNNSDFSINGYNNELNQMGMPNGPIVNGSAGGMVINGPPSQMPQQQSMHSYHPTNGQNVMVSMPSNVQQQSQPPSVLQELLLSNTPGTMNSPRPHYNPNYNNNREIRSPANGQNNNAQNMMSPSAPTMGIPANRMPHHSQQQMRQQMHPGMQNPQTAPPHRPQQMYARRTGPQMSGQPPMQWQQMHPQQQQSNQWAAQQQPQGQQVYIQQQQTSQQPSNMQPQNPHQRGPQHPPNQHQPIGYAPSPQQMHQGMNGQQQPPGAVMSVGDERQMVPNIQTQPGQPNFNLGAQNLLGRSQALHSQDPEKRKLIQQQLVLLLHAHKCQQREKTEVNVRNQCTLPHCGTMKAVLDHMISCNNGRACSYPHCASSRQIITHWKNCSKDDCPVCKPLKTFSRSGSTNPPSNIGPGSLNSQSSLDAASGLLVDYNPSNNDPFRSNNPPNKVAPPNGSGRMSATGFTSENFTNLPPPDPPSQEKEWHSMITQDLRNHLVSKLVKAIFPSPDPAAIQDQRLKDLISYARKVEKDMFENANDKEEYYHLLAEKIYKIQKELQEKKNRRLHEQGATDNFRPGTSLPPTQMHNQQPVMSNGMPNQQNSMGPGSVNRSQVPPYGYSQFPPESHMQNAQQQAPMQMQAPQSQSASQNPMSIPSQGQPPSMIRQDSVTSQQMRYPSINDMKPEPVEVKQEPITIKQDSTTNKPEAASMKTEAIQNTPPTRTIAPVSNPAIKKSEQRDETPVEEKIFDANELRCYLKPILEKLGRLEESLPFRVPVNAEELKIPDYYDIIKNPMDMETMEKKLNLGAYKNPWEFCEDMWLMFDNAWLYNRKNSKVYKYCTKLSEVFAEFINPVMRQMGYCCGQKLSFTPMALFCFGASTCIIARDQQYKLYESGSSKFGVTVSDRYVYCLKCFEALPPEGINLNDNPSDPPNMAPKEKFQTFKNDQIDLEPFELCKCCRRKWHRICALHSKKVYPEGFICDSCRIRNKIPKPENKFTAKRLPHCRLSQYIEERVNTFMANNMKVKGNYEVVIRVLCASEKEVEVKPLMKAKYSSEGFPERFPYKTKAIFAFEVIDGVEVCFFGLHVQEYGSKCPPPNRRRVYIAYLDSVHFFQPRELRTDVYHEILLGYLQYVKNLGYTMAHIWACPPSEGDDYIFHCHPPEQKIPKPKRLQDWYKRMLDKGRQEETVYEYKDILKQAKDDDLQSPTSLPYFEGDFWPNMIEDCIRDAEKEENERRKLEQSLAAAADDDEDDLFQTDDGLRLKKNNKSSKKKSNLKKLSKQKKKAAAGTGNEVTDKLFNLFEKHKEVFFTIRLVSQQAELSINNHEIEDPDALMSSELMDGRDTFLSKARDEHWEFSSMRRAKYSTLNFCHALHTQENKDIATYTCNKCGNNDGKWHCTVCEDYDLCANCYQEIGHEHKMEEVKQLIEVDKSNESHNARNESVKKCIQSLVHACQCRDANCRRSTCMKMKRVVQHTKLCKRRQTTNCSVCKQLIALCCYHAKHCDLAQCHVPFCSNIRQKLQEQKRSQNRRADMMMRRRIEKLHAAGGGGSQSTQSSAPASQPSTSNTPQMQQGSQMSMQPQHSQMAVNSQQYQPSPHGQNTKPLHSQHQMTQSHGHMNGNDGSHYQQQTVPSKLNPAGMHPPPQYHQTQMPMQNQMPGMHMNQQRMHSNQQMHPSQMQMSSHSHMMSGSSQQHMNPHGQGPVSQSSKAVYENESRVNQQVCEIFHRLQSFQDGEERKRLLLELKKTPHLFAAFLKIKSTNERNGQKLPSMDIVNASINPNSSPQYAASQHSACATTTTQQLPQYYSQS